MALGCSISPSTHQGLTLYEEVRPQRSLGGRQVPHRVLRRLAGLIAATAVPIIVADAGFRVPFDREVERLGWRWVGRVRGRDRVKLTARWSSSKRVFAQATETPTALGIGEWVRSHPLPAVFVLVRQPQQGQQLVSIDGLAQVGVHARGPSPFHVFLKGVGGQGDDGYSRVKGADLSGRRVAIQPRELR